MTIEFVQGNKRYSVSLSVWFGEVLKICYSGGAYSSERITCKASLKKALLSRDRFNIEQELGGSIPDLDESAKKILEWLG